MKNLIALTFVLLLCGSRPAYAQVAENSSLFREIMSLDNQIFEQGFNQCKPGVFEKYTADDLEFFHDKGGTQNRAQFLEAVKKNVCANPEGKPLRTLVPGSSKIFALENNGVIYGAVQEGIHQFHTKGTEPAVEGYTVSRFTNVWILRNGQWKLKTSISFDHQKKTGKLSTAVPLKKKAASLPVPLFELRLASMSWGFYFRNLRN